MLIRGGSIERVLACRPCRGSVSLVSPWIAFEVRACALLCCPSVELTAGLFRWRGSKQPHSSAQHKGERQGRELPQLSQSLAGPRAANQPQASGSKAGPVCNGATAFRGCQRRQASASTPGRSVVPSLALPVSAPWPSPVEHSSKLTQTQRADIYRCAMGIVSPVPAASVAGD